MVVYMWHLRPYPHIPSCIGQYMQHVKNVIVMQKTRAGSMVVSICSSL